jgi:hypothetical protein
MEFAEIFANDLTTAVYMYGSFVMMLILAAAAASFMPSRSRQMTPSPVRA